MTRRHLPLLVFLALVPVSIGAEEAEEAEDSPTEWISLFDGESLAGWHIEAREEDRNRDFWRVEDGAIVVDSRGSTDHDYVWLVSDGEYADFELRLEFQAIEGTTGNSGVQVRSRYDTGIEGGWMHGLQVDLGPGDPWRTGLLYDETREVQHWVSPEQENWELEEKEAWPEGLPQGWTFEVAGSIDEPDAPWNQLVIRCEGTQITTTLNGVEITDWDGAGVLDDETHSAAGVGLEGHLALQAHSEHEILLRFRAIELREL